MVLMWSRKRSSPSASIFCGVSATANSSRVALLTPASVACAESTTATSSVYGLRCSNSPFGSGLALQNRSKASRISAGVQDFDALSFGALSFDALNFEALNFEALNFEALGLAAFRDFLAARAGAVAAFAVPAFFADSFGRSWTRAA